MRKCFVERTYSSVRPWNCRGLRTSLRSRPRAIKQLNNAELLKIIQESKQNNELPRDLEPLLPRSPLEESRLVTARSRHRTEKPAPSKERSPFQLKLLKNPYAQALSTPPRLCLLTGVRLPSYFQIPFGLAKHPKTGAHWHTPRLADLVSNPNAANMKPSSSSSTSPEVKPGLDSKGFVRTASGTHFVASRDSLKYVSSLTKPGYRRLLPYRWKEDSTLRVPDIVWREDMDTFVLEILRKSVIRELDYLTSRPAGYIATCKSYENISDHAQASAILWLGRDSEMSSQEISSDSRSRPEDEGPPPYAMHHYRSHYVPFYNLFTLLGPIHLRPLRENKPAHFVDQFAVIKSKRTTVKLQLELWKLLGYMIHQEEVVADAGEMAWQKA